MTDISLNISNKLEPVVVDVYHAIHNCAAELGIPFMVIGASARDIILHHGYGIPLKRATRDIDFGVQVPSWAAFTSLKEALKKSGFSATKSEHRLLSPTGMSVDIVPFGELESPKTTIKWPPNQDWVMSVQGFDEALACAQWVCIKESPVVEVKVVSPPGLVLLKLIAWMDRPANVRPKDAADFYYVLKHYHQLPEVEKTLYENIELLQTYEYDTTLAAAYQLGQDANAVVSQDTRNTVSDLLANKHPMLSVEKLLDDINNVDRTEAERYLKAFISGFGVVVC